MVGEVMQDKFCKEKVNSNHYCFEKRSPKKNQFFRVKQLEIDD